MYTITYTIDNPYERGPFKGSATVNQEYAKGEVFYTSYGRATVVACELV